MNGFLQEERKLHILVVEDDDHDFAFLKGTLERAGIATLSRVSDGMKALEYLEMKLRYEDQIPDIILVDLRLPGLSGHELLAAIERIPALADARRYVVTGDLKADDAARAKRHGARACFLKPLSLGHVAEILDDPLGAPLGRP